MTRQFFNTPLNLLTRAYFGDVISFTLADENAHPTFFVDVDCWCWSWCWGKHIGASAMSSVTADCWQLNKSIFKVWQQIIIVGQILNFSLHKCRWNPWEIASKESKAEVSELFQYVKWVWGEFAIKTTKSKNHGERNEMFYPFQILVPFGPGFALLNTLRSFSSWW